MTRQKLSHEEQLRRKHRQWHHHLLVWERSGLSQAEYCRRNSLSSKCFTYWKMKFKQQGSQIQLVPVPLISNHKSSVAGCYDTALLKVKVERRFTIEVPDGFSSETLSRLISALTRC